MNNQKQHTSQLGLTNLVRFNENAERIVIGTLLTTPNTITDLCDGLEPEHFYDTFYSDVFAAIMKLDNENKKIDAITVAETMKRSGIVVDYSKLMETCDSYTHSIVPHSIMVKEKAIERKMLLSIREAAASIEQNEDIGDVLFEASGKIEKLQESLVGSNKSEHISVAVLESVARLNERIENRNKGITQGVPTGLVDLNHLTGGWQKKDLIIIAARPSMGKTALMLSCASAAAKDGKSVAIFSLEMGKEQLTDRMIIGESGINADAYKAGIIRDDLMPNIDRATNTVASLPIYIDDRPSVTVGYIKSRCRVLYRQGKCDLLMIDYLQLMNGTKENNGNREQEISSISRGCKAIAKELNIPVILLSQLNRECEKRADKRPMLSDLRESGAIEQDADIVCFINRPARYNMDCFDSNGNKIENGMELIFAKNRSGNVGIIYAQHNESLTKMYDINNGQFQEHKFNSQPMVTEQKVPF